MSPVDVDVTSIPDMIEAQLTLSYSRLANLVRLIIDQGNDHDVDIDKLSSSVDALKDENAALRSIVESLLAEKARDKDLEAKMDELRQEVLRVSDACAENSKQVSALADQSRQCFEDWGERLKQESRNHTNEVDQVYASFRNIQKLVSGLEGALGFLNNFVELWEGSEKNIEVLTKRGADGEFQCSTDERVEYLHSLPPFARLWEELDVVRRMVRQQASDALAAKTVAGALRRVSAAEAAVVASATHSSDHDVLQKIKNSLDEIALRVGALEARELSFVDLPDKKETPRPEAAVVISSDKEEREYEERKEGKEEKESTVQLGDRLREVENRLRNFPSLSVEGVGTENAILMGIESRLRALESVVGITPSFPSFLEQLDNKQGAEKARPGVSASQSLHIQLQPQRPTTALSAQEGVSTHIGKDAEPFLLAADEGGITLPYLPTAPQGRKETPVVTYSTQQSIEKQTVAPKRNVSSFADQPTTEASRQSATPLPLSNLQSQGQTQVQVQGQGQGQVQGQMQGQGQGQVQGQMQGQGQGQLQGQMQGQGQLQGRKQQALASDNGEVLHSIARLQEGMLELEQKKADRRELALLEETFRGLLQAQGGYSPYGVPCGSALRRPVSHNGLRIGGETGYAVSGGDASRMAPKSAPASRPMFVGTASHNLRDSSGAITPVTVTGSQLT